MKAKIIGTAAAFAALLAIGGDADAGVKDPTDIVLLPGNFQGSLGATRNNSGPSDVIGCWTNGNGVASCTVTDGPTTISCSTSTAGHVAALRAMSGDAFISVSYSGGTCTSLTVHANSRYAPK